MLFRTLTAAAGVWFFATTAMATPPAPESLRPTTDCAWSGLTPAQQDVMIYGGETRGANSANIRVGLAQLPANLDIVALASACGAPTDKLDEFATALSWRSKEEGAQRALSRLGRNPNAIEAALPHLFAKHRRDMGDALSCPQTVQIKPDWDRAVRHAVSRLRDTSLIAQSFSLTALGLYARTAQEGAERRLRGEAQDCPAQRNTR